MKLSVNNYDQSIFNFFLMKMNVLSSLFVITYSVKYLLYSIEYNRNPTQLKEKRIMAIGSHI